MASRRIPLLLLAVLLAACGREAPTPDRGGPSVPPEARDCLGKPGAAIGEVQAYVVERPAPDRAEIVGVWTAGPVAGSRRLELVLPEGAWLLDGTDSVALPDDAPEGKVRWSVGFDAAGPLDAVVRFAVDAAGGACAREAYVRLVRDPDEPPVPAPASGG